VIEPRAHRRRLRDDSVEERDGVVDTPRPRVAPPRKAATRGRRAP
jgi:hypothetical protein